MDPLRVALVSFDRERARPGQRPYGWWSYPVPEFDVTWHPVSAMSSLGVGEFAGYDIIVQEDYKTRITWEGSGIPRCYHAVDTTISEGRRQDRMKWGMGADLILVDQDRLERFEALGVPVRRFGYCVNDRLFCDYNLERDIDVGWYFRAPNKEQHPRRELHRWLQGFCEEHDYVYNGGKRLGEVDGRPTYATYLNRSKVAMNLSVYPACRTHRVFDAMACGAALVTSPLPDVSEEVRTVGWHYLEFGDHDHLASLLDGLLQGGGWKDLGRSGQELVSAEHTWAVRASQLRETLGEVLGV